MRNFYSILEISQTASLSEIKKAYRRLAIKYHPDHNQDDANAEKIMKEIIHAYTILSDTETRKTYDYDYIHRAERQKRDKKEREDRERREQEKAEEKKHHQTEENSYQSYQSHQYQKQWQYKQTQSSSQRNNFEETLYNVLNWLWNIILEFIIIPLAKLTLKIIIIAIIIFLALIALSIAVILFVWLFIK
ncbi:MAG: DnaJ domain-containing protein [Bacteroidales bacterium]